MLDVVCGVIGNDRGEILACRRPVGKHLGGLWEFPGGKIDAGETAREALERELQEELGIVVEVGGELSPVVWDYGSTVIRLHPFFCSIRSGEPHPHEHEEIRWCGLKDWDGLEWASADLPILDELRKSAWIRSVDSDAREARFTEP